MENILVATDGSENSKKALMEARKIAEYMGSDVTIINISANLPAYVQGSSVDIIKKSAIKHQNEILEESLKIFEDFPRKVDTVRKKGEAGEAIIKEGEKGKYDLVIMGSRGEGGFSKAILGSISNKVLNHVSKNVLIIK